MFFTGPNQAELVLAKKNNSFYLPWKAEVSRLVVQGNRSFTSHRGLHLYAWDFFMPNGTEVLASRSGVTTKVIDSFEGIGLNNNVILIKHEDGLTSAYAHIRESSSLVSVGDRVEQGQPIAMSGMVGETIFPHLHFYVTGPDGNSSIPVSFIEVNEGVPLAGKEYTSKNYFKLE